MLSLSLSLTLSLSLSFIFLFDISLAAVSVNHALVYYNGCMTNRVVHCPCRGWPRDLVRFNGATRIQSLARADSFESSVPN